MTKKEAIKARKYNPDRIKELLTSNDKMVTNSLMVLYKQQTTEEQAIHDTRETNGVGFNKFDAEFLTSLADQFIRTGSLSPKQVEGARKALLKYSKQLSDLSETSIKAS